MKQLVIETERVWKLLGEVDYSPSKAEKGSIIFRHFVYKVKDINAGDVFRKKTGS